MPNLFPVIIGGGVIALVVLGLSKIQSLNDFYQNLIITPKIDGGLKNFKLTLSTLSVPIAVEFGNRSDQQITLSLQALDLLYKGKVVAQSKPSAMEVVLSPNSLRTLAGIKLDVSTFSLISIGGSIVQNLINDLSSGFNTTAFINAAGELTKNMSANIVIVFNRSVNLRFSTKIGEAAASVNGLGLVPAGERSVAPYGKFEMYFPPKSELNRSDLIVIKNCPVEDTVRFMKKVCRQYNSDTAMLANALKTNNIEQTLQNIFDFIFKHIKYVPDSKFIEQVRRPLRCLYDKQGDCDCYATLIGSILENLNIPYKFRIAAYNDNSYYQHVYVIVPNGNGYYTCDPVVDRFNYEKPYSKKKDF